MKTKNGKFEILFKNVETVLSKTGFELLKIQSKFIKFVPHHKREVQRSLLFYLSFWEHIPLSKSKLNNWISDPTMVAEWLEQ